MSEYAASKHAINGFMRTIRLEFKSRGTNITTTNIYPWLIKTGMFEGTVVPFPTGIFFPMLEEADVAKSIYSAHCEGLEEVILPFSMNFVCALSHFLPTWLYDKISAFTTGGAFAKFIGRKKID
jgi:short-subunit dehydrogenase